RAEIQHKEVEHRSPDYEKALDLRDRVLRAPLSLDFTKEQLDAESDETHLVAKSVSGDILATACLVWTDETTAKLRQVAVEPDSRGLGLGEEIVRFAESRVALSGRSSVYCHARHTVIGFYEKLGYKIIGTSFE
ncbi:MAG: GNAT family N-acetyltransferase, partial [Verrucomicrobiota bacterium]